MTDITELAQRMKAAAGKATQGEWWADEVKNEGCYGSGDYCVEGFTSYAIYGSDGQTLFDSLNSDAACISEEYDGEGHVAWDETAQRNAEFIALANPANVLALVEALEKAHQRIDELENDEVRQRLANAERQLYMAELAKNNLRASRKAQFRKRKAAEQRIAELESRTVTVENLQESAYRAGLTAGWNLGLANNNEGFNKCLAAHTAGIKVEAE
ncbi:TPA: ead/Ea22-like family protein [Klebsiella pneumoniae]|nr:ead/Ea22-like family protein [Klebsiella pneumoniae]HCB0712742.1 ead/Ea22-like family protein [Klebsiella pneumoniae]